MRDELGGRGNTHCCLQVTRKELQRTFELHTRTSAGMDFKHKENTEEAIHHINRTPPPMILELLFWFFFQIRRL